ncbi:MAG: lamin tail domain-containing protein, partial [Chloroflexi bacterium]|nr:lamin tail domain-containing protein [Chloroflexota bacterium]
MARARRAAAAALCLVSVLTSVALGTAGPSALFGTAGQSAAVPLADVAWSPSTLLVSEVSTGGVSASDEFIELVNAGSGSVDLLGLEIVYVTASGSTVTRKAMWTETRPLGPGQRLLLANAGGVYVSVADSSYTGGLAATGGTVVLRPVGGAPIDAIGWGDATNAFVEAMPALPPPAGSSTERRPGGTAGNATDTNDNAADWFVQASPSPQNLLDPPVPAPSPGPSGSPAPSGTPGASPPPSGPPTPGPTPGPTVPPTAVPTSSP